MSQYKRLLQLYFKENKFEINDLLFKLSNKTIKCIVNDLQIEQNEQVTNNTLYIFSDGNCRRNGKIGAKAGYSVFFSDDISSPYFKFNKTRLIISEPTNNKAELSGIKYIYDIISQNKDLFKQNDNIICTDSMYSINCIENWSKTWRKNGWKNSKGEIVKNKILIEEILELKDDISNDIMVWK
jgi:ribonuclease HI